MNLAKLRASPEPASKQTALSPFLFAQKAYAYVIYASASPVIAIPLQVGVHKRYMDGHPTDKGTNVIE